MKSAKLGFLLGFSLFCLLSPPVLSFVEKVAARLCKEFNDPCALEMDPGSCYESHYRFFYNQTSKKCQIFVFSGCNGNRNNFMLKIDCDVMCNEEYKVKPQSQETRSHLRVTSPQPGGLKQTERKPTGRQRARRESGRQPLARHHAE
uniref:Serine peptidase inhibitor, Kunitz type 4 n=1 Tax=Rattus norvegicus TaxID=10116 RepID=D4A0Q5_RAT